MLSVDLHVHTNNSLCGLHTYLEMLDAAVSKGLKAVAITDHGKTLGGKGVKGVFLHRFPAEYKGLRVFKGIELNVLSDGSTDVPFDLLPALDIVLLAIHPNIKQGQGETYYTDLLLKCMEQNPFIDILSHPDILFYPVNIGEVVKMAASFGIAVEFNNSNITYNKTDLSKMKEMAEAVRNTSCRAVISGDAHSFHEIGEDGDLRDICRKLAIEIPQIVNVDLESASRFIQDRRKFKQR